MKATNKKIMALSPEQLKTVDEIIAMLAARGFSLKVATEVLRAVDNRISSVGSPLIPR